MGKNLKGKELGKGITQRKKRGDIMEGNVDRFGDRKIRLWYNGERSKKLSWQEGGTKANKKLIKYC